MFVICLYCFYFCFLFVEHWFPLNELYEQIWPWTLHFLLLFSPCAFTLMSKLLLEQTCRIFIKKRTEELNDGDPDVEAVVKAVGFIWSSSIVGGAFKNQRNKQRSSDTTRKLWNVQFLSSPVGAVSISIGVFMTCLNFPTNDRNFKLKSRNSDIFCMIKKSVDLNICNFQTFFSFTKSLFFLKICDFSISRLLFLGNFRFSFNNKMSFPQKWSCTWH